MKTYKIFTLALIILFFLTGSAGLLWLGVQQKAVEDNAIPVTGKVVSYSYKETNAGFTIYPKVEYVIDEETYVSEAPVMNVAKNPYEDVTQTYEVEVFYNSDQPKTLVDMDNMSSTNYMYGVFGTAGIALLLSGIGIVKSLRKKLK